MGMKAVVFPGQGSQYTGMGLDLYDNFIEAKDMFLKINKLLGFEISKICFSPEKEILKRTFYQQLAILTVSLITYEIFSKKNIKIDLFSGLSLGEYSCLYPTGVLSLEKLLYLVQERAKAMEEAALFNPSVMLAVIGLDLEVLKDNAKSRGFYISNINSKSQVVISLKREDKERIKDFFEKIGAKVVELDVSGGFHSPFMMQAKAHLEKVINNLEFNDAGVPIVSNFTARAHIDKNEIKYNLIEQLTSTVLWKDSVEYMISEGVDTFIEIGPSKIISGLIRKIDNRVKVFNIEKKEDFDRLVLEN